MCLKQALILSVTPLFLHLTIAQHDRDRGPLGGLTMPLKIIIMEYALLTPSISLPTKCFPHWEKKEFPMARSYKLWVLLCCDLAVQCCLHPGFCKQREDLVQDHKGLCRNYTSAYPTAQSSIVERVNNNFLLHKIMWHFLENTGSGQLSGRISLLESRTESYPEKNQKN